MSSTQRFRCLSQYRQRQPDRQRPCSAITVERACLRQLQNEVRREVVAVAVLAVVEDTGDSDVLNPAVCRASARNRSKTQVNRRGRRAGSSLLRHGPGPCPCFPDLAHSTDGDPLGQNICHRARWWLTDGRAHVTVVQQRTYPWEYPVSTAATRRSRVRRIRGVSVYDAAEHRLRRHRRRCLLPASGADEG